MSKRRIRLRTMIGGLTVSALAILWLASRVDSNTLKAAFSRLSPGWIPLLVGVYLTGFLLRGLRWQLMLRPVREISLFNSIAIILVGYMANNLLPARLGEIVRAWALGRSAGVSTVTSLASIGVERVFDGLALLLIFALSALIAPFAGELDPIVPSVGGGASAIFLGALVTLIMARIWPERLRALVLRVLGWAPRPAVHRIERLLDRVLESLKFLALDRRLPAFLSLSLGVWLIEGSMYVLALVAFDLPPSLGMGYFLLALVNFGILIPSAPGYVGVYQTCTVLAFGLFGLSPELALGYSITLHAVQYLPVTLLGLVALGRLGLSWSGVLGKDQESTE